MHAVHAKRTLARVVLEDFFRKELKLSAIRLLEFKSRLNVRPAHPDAIMLQVQPPSIPLY